MEEKQNVCISLLGQASPWPVGCVCGPSSSALLPTNLGHRKPHLLGPSANPCLMPAFGPGGQLLSLGCCCWAPSKAGASHTTHACGMDPTICALLEGGMKVS